MGSSRRSSLHTSLSRFIEDRLCEENAVGLWQFVQLYRLKRLEEACLRWASSSSGKNSLKHLVLANKT